MSEKRLMKTEEEVRKRAKELLLLPKEDLLTQYMFQEQEIERLKKDNGYLNKVNIELSTEKNRLNNIINECAEDILKELEENHHLSYGVAIAIRQKLLDYKELKGSVKSERD